MALKTKIAKLEDVAEPLRELYEAKDGAYVLKVEGDAADVFPGLTESQKAILAEKKTLADKLKALEGQLSGIDLEKAKKALADADKAEQERLKTQGDWESREKQITEKYQAEIKTREDRLAQQQRSIEKHLVEAQAVAAIAAAKGVPELLLPHVKASIKVFEENGEFVAKVVDAQGNPRIADVKGTPLSIAGLVEEMKGNQIFGRAFEGTGAGGSGAQPNTSGGNGGAKTKTRAEFEQLSHGDRAKFMKEGGQVV